MHRHPPRKIYQIGFGLTGVLSLHHYLTRNQINTVQWDEGRLARTAADNITAGRPAFTGYEHFQAFLNMEYVSTKGEVINIAEQFLAEIVAGDPDGIYLFNVQPVEQLIDIRSRLYGYLPAAMDYFSTDEQGVFRHWRAAYDAHLARVSKVFSDQGGRLITYDMTRHTPADLDAMFWEHGFSLHSSHWQDIPEVRGSVDLMAHVRNIREAALYFRHHQRDLPTAISLLEISEQYKPCSEFYRDELASWQRELQSEHTPDQSPQLSAEAD